MATDDQHVVPARPHHEWKLARTVSSGMMPTPMKTLPSTRPGRARARASATVADAAPTKKYHFELTAVTREARGQGRRREVGAGRASRRRSRRRSRRTRSSSQRSTARPIPKTNADAYRKFLTKKGDRGRLPRDRRDHRGDRGARADGGQAEHAAPGRSTSASTCSARPSRAARWASPATARRPIKQEVGMKLRDKDRDYAWDGAAETAVDDAMKTVFAQLAKPAAASSSSYLTKLPMRSKRMPPTSTASTARSARTTAR